MGYDDQEFAEYLKNINNRAIINQAFVDSKVKSELERTEIAGYKKVHHNFADRFHTISWQDGDRQDNIRSQIVRNDSGDELATIKEITHKINTLVFLSDGTFKQINSYRTIDLPTELENKSGPMHLSLAVKDENGRNISLDRAVYFTAHYDSRGKLSEISSPKPVRFNGEGDEAIGYIEHLGHVYSLPVTQGKYREMMLALEKNKGQEIDLSQIVAIAQDNVITANVDLSRQEDKKQYHQEGKKLAEEKLTQLAQHYQLAKERAEIITKGLQYVSKNDNAANRQLFEQQAADFKTIHDRTPQQAIIEYQAILDMLQPAMQAREQERKLLQQLVQQHPTLAGKAVAQHFTTHAVAYKQEKKDDINSKALEELDFIVKICGGYKKLGLTPITKQSPELSKIKQQSAKMEQEADKLMAKLETTNQALRKELNKIQALADNLLESNPYKEKLTIFVKLKLEEQEAIRTGNPLPKSKERDEALNRTEAAKQIDQGTNNNLANYCKTLTDRMKKKFIGSDSQLHGEKAEEKTSLVCNVNLKPNANIILPPVQTPQVQSNKTQVNKR
ncbi:MAG: Sca4 family protein [Rickettsiaceae bacterium]|nr:Sca4 family protein [Rickettsiaceae bacterium]MDD9337406.1 Sca4 family protein [Rickettsiaceae bacterium]